MATSSAPAAGALTISPHDTTPLTRAIRALYVGGAGNVKVTMNNGTVVTFVGISAGSILPIRASIVWSTGTTATSMVGLY